MSNKAINIDSASGVVDNISISTPVIFPAGTLRADNFIFRPESYGGVPDGNQNDAITTVAGSTTISAASAIFSAADAALDFYGKHKAIGIYDGTCVDVASVTMNSTTTITMTTTTGLYAGMWVSGAKGSIALGTKISSVTTSGGTTTVVLTTAALLTGTFLVCFCPNMIVTTITGFTDSQHVTVASSAGLLSASNVRIVWGTDNTAAIQAASTACTAFGGGVVQFQAGIYLVSAPATNTSTYNSIIALPATSTKMFVQFNGAGPSNRGDSGFNPSEDLPLTGTTIFGITPASGSGLTLSSVFSGNATGGFGGTTGADILFSNLGIQVPVQGGCTGINMLNAGGLMVSNISVSNDVPKQGGQLPASPNYGIIFPNFNNDGVSSAQDVDIVGFGTGIYTALHFNGRSLQVSVCNSGITLNNFNRIFGAHFVSNVVDFTFNNPSGNGYAGLYGILFEDNSNCQYTCNFLTGFPQLGFMDCVFLVGSFTSNVAPPVNFQISRDTAGTRQLYNPPNVQGKQTFQTNDNSFGANLFLQNTNAGTTAITQIQFQNTSNGVAFFPGNYSSNGLPNSMTLYGSNAAVLEVNNVVILTATSSFVTSSQDIAVSTVGKGLRVKEGTNGKQGVATLVAGTVTVANTSVTANSRIFLTAQDNNTVGCPRVSARTAGTSFTITSNSSDTGVIAWEIFEPA